MDLNSVLIHMNIYSAQKNSIGRTKSIQRREKEEKMEVSPLALNHASSAVALCLSGFGSVICSPFDSWRNPFHFALLSFYFSPCPRPSTSCTCSIPHSPTLDPHECFGWVSDTAGGHTLRTWAPFQNRLMGNVILRTNGQKKDKNEQQHTYTIAHSCMGASTHTIQGYFTQIANKLNLKNRFSHLPPAVSSNADSFGFICPGEISLHEMRQMEFHLWCSPVVARKYPNHLLK